MAITPKAITVTAAPNTKFYDGTTTATAVPAISAGGLATGDTASFQENYDTAAIGVGKTLTPAGSVSDGNNGSNYLVTTVPNTTGVINGKYAISLLGGNTVTAGTSFIFTVQATDSAGNALISYSGPTSITVTLNPADNQGILPVTGSLNASGFGFFLGTLKTTGTYTITVTAGLFLGTSSLINVTPANAVYFTVAAPATGDTGSPIPVTVTAFDQYGNIATGYTGTVKLSTTDTNAALGSPYSFTTGAGKDNGVHTFSVTFNSGATQVIAATDTVATTPTITGTSTPIIARGLVVTSFMPTATGFKVTFNKPFVPTDVTLYGSTSSAVADVTLFGSNGVGAIHGSLLIDPLNQGITFSATQNYVALLNTLHGSPDSVILPDATYTAKLVSGAGGNGFLDAVGAGLDGANNGGHANFTTTFATHYQASATPVLAIPDFARGPDSNTPIAVPTSNFGIPITLYNAANVSDVTFSLTYNASLLNLTGTLSGTASDATDPAAGLTLVANAGGVATFHYSAVTPASATATNPLVLGDLTAVVPSGAGAAALGLYQVKDLLQLGAIVINKGAGPGAISANGVHVNAYLGDVNGDKIIDGLDKLAADSVAQGHASGFSAYVQLDPAIIGDVAGDTSVDAGDVSTLDAYVVQLQPTQIPLPPTQLSATNPRYVNPNLLHSPNAADPTLSLAAHAPTPGGAPVISVLVDNGHPDGSTGLNQASLALTYDPSILSVTPNDISLGSLTNEDAGWHISSVIDASKGQIGILLYSPMPVTTIQAGSLVNIAFQVLHGTPRNVNLSLAHAVVQLVDNVTPNGQRFDTTLADAQGGLILSPGMDSLPMPTILGYAAKCEIPSPVSPGNEVVSGSDNLRAESAARRDHFPDRSSRSWV